MQNPSTGYGVRGVGAASDQMVAPPRYGARACGSGGQPSTMRVPKIMRISSYELLYSYEQHICTMRFLSKYYIDKAAATLLYLDRHLHPRV